LQAQASLEQLKSVCKCIVFDAGPFIMRQFIFMVSAQTNNYAN